MNERERQREREYEGGWVVEKKNCNRTANLAWGIGADLENVGRVLISPSLSLSLSFPCIPSLYHSLTLSIDF